MKKIAEFKIDALSERKELTSILACNGYKVTVEEREGRYHYNKTHWVVVYE